ncbi:hypothetical protein VP01_218g3 [Puccinia sorghi]|uniref:Uncharacterized protein n=1 Tax=Puccinia sorghi TaxID=27349 RepID=A0A0L6VAY9_9BASI|nr:hypothetical protein VP01_218g3 [Puccinia sorghi]
MSLFKDNKLPHELQIFLLVPLPPSCSCVTEFPKGPRLMGVSLCNCVFLPRLIGLLSLLFGYCCWLRMIITLELERFMIICKVNGFFGQCRTETGPIRLAIRVRVWRISSCVVVAEAASFEASPGCCHPWRISSFALATKMMATHTINSRASHLSILVSCCVRFKKFTVQSLLELQRRVGAAIMKHEDMMVARILTCTLVGLSFSYSVPEADAPAIQNWPRDFTEELSYSDGELISSNSNGYRGRISIGFEGHCLAGTRPASYCIWPIDAFQQTGPLNVRGHDFLESDPFPINFEPCLTSESQEPHRALWRKILVTCPHSGGHVPHNFHTESQSPAGSSSR